MRNKATEVTDKMKISYYTPPLLADKLVKFIMPTRIAYAVDFCVGDGDLLKAVAKRYWNEQIFGRKS